MRILIITSPFPLCSYNKRRFTPTRTTHFASSQRWSTYARTNSTYVGTTCDLGCMHRIVMLVPVWLHSWEGNVSVLSKLKFFGKAASSQHHIMCATHSRTDNRRCSLGAGCQDHVVAGTRMSLYHLENNIIRQHFTDPRIFLVRIITV